VKFWRTVFGKDAETTTVADDPGAADELILSGQRLEDEGRLAEALSHYLRAVQRAPSSAKAHLNAGNAHLALRNTSAAAVMYRRAGERDPQSAAVQLNLGTALLMAEDFVAADQAYRQALKLSADMTEAWIGLGCALENLGRLQEAAAALSRALEIQPAHAGAAANLSGVYVKSLDVPAARETLYEFLRRNPGELMIMRTLAALEQSSGRIQESTSILRALADGDPHDFTAWSMLIFNLCYRIDCSALDSLDECRRFGQALEGQIPARSLTKPTAQDNDRRLRVGYVSGDFTIHPMANFIHPVLRCHDRQAFEIFCYHTLNNADSLTQQIKEVADHWRDVAGDNDERIADTIMHDRIDILVDLSGHSGGNRLGVFARKPAALQYTWLGYLGTTGLKRMDYRLCDAHTDPPGIAEGWQTETPARLPDSQWCYDQRIVAVPAVSPLPRLERGYWTFGSFNNYRKLNERVLAAWAQVLIAVPDSRLIMFSFENRESGEHAVAALVARGIERHRVDWVVRTSPEGHIDSFAGIDIALDSFPYNGATTTCDALLMGVPVLVVAGERQVARGGVSLLSSMGLNDWIADSEHELADVARRQLASVEAIAQLRQDLRPRMRSSALMDATRFTRNLENLYRTAWHRLCQAAE
jgi:protein O-GlcNAc transferase